MKIKHKIQKKVSSNEQKYRKNIEYIAAGWWLPNLELFPRQMVPEIQLSNFSRFTHQINLFNLVANFNRIVDFSREKVKSGVKIIWPKNFELVTPLTVQIAICNSDAKIGPFTRLKENFVRFHAVEIGRSCSTLYAISLG